MEATKVSTFPRIDPEHPLTVAARETNDHAETHGMPETLAWLGMDVEAEQAAYLAEQRAIRAIAAASLGVSMGADQRFDEATARAIVQTPLWRDMRMLLVAMSIDGMAIGWRAHEVADARKGDVERL